MRRIILFCAFTAMLLACTKSADSLDPGSVNGQVIFNLAIDYPKGSETKSVKQGWENGDIVYVFFKNIGYIKKTYNNGVWTDHYIDGTFSAQSFARISDEDKKMTAVYFPYEITVNSGSESTGLKYRIASKYSYYLYTIANYTVEGSTVSGALKMEKPEDFVQFFIPEVEEEDVPRYKLMESHVLPTTVLGINYSGEVVTSSKSAGIALDALPYAGGALYSGVLTTAGESTRYSFDLVEIHSESAPFAIGTQEVSATKVIPQGVVLHFPAVSEWPEQEPWVKMGGLIWATGDLKGSEIVSPEAEGGYYAWGETSSKSSSYPGDYKFTAKSEEDNNGHSTIGLTKYCYNSASGYEGYTDNLTVLQDEDDAARTNLGNHWRIPTKAECEALSDADNYYFSTYYTSSTFGHLVVKNRSDGMAILLRMTTPDYSGFGSFYWCTALTVGYDNDSWHAWALNSKTTKLKMEYRNRRYGNYIRPVKDIE